MSVDAAPKPSYPEIKSVHRLASVPIVHDSIHQIDSIITANAYTNYVKIWAQAWGAQAYKISEPYGAKLAPVITTADAYANQGLDFVQRRFPYPFIAPTEEVIQKVKAPADQAYGVGRTYADAATKAFDDRVIAPAYGVAQNVDKGMTPYVDQLETRVRVYVPHRTSEGDEAKTSLGRVYGLTKDVQAHVVELSAEQFKQLQQQSVLLQRATDGVHQLNGTLTTTAQAAKDQSHAIAVSLLQTLDSLQQSTAKLPSDIQSALQPFSDRIFATLEQMVDVSRADLPLGEKVGRLAGTAQEGLAPILQMATERVQKLIWGAKVEADKAAGAAGAAGEVGEAAELRAEQAGEVAGDMVNGAAEEAHETFEQAQEQVNGS